MADSVDRVFGHALNTVNKIRPGSQKPPLSDRQELYGLYKQSMEGDVAEIADRPTLSSSSSSAAAGAAGNLLGASASSTPSSSAAATASAADNLRKEQEKWDAWKSNEGLSRTQAKRRYIEKLIDTMHKYASFTPEARELVEELEFVWDQIKNNSVGTHSGSSERSSPLRHTPGVGGGGDARDIDDDDEDGEGGYLGSRAAVGGVAAAAMESAQRREGEKLMRVLSPVSQAEEEELRREADEEKDEEEFVDAPISQVDGEDLGVVSEGESGIGSSSGAGLRSLGGGTRADARWRRRIESGLIKLTLEVAALREQLESKRYLKLRSRQGILGWVLRLSWWAVQLFVADAVILWIVILYMRRREDHRLEMAVRVLLGDAVAQVQRVGNQVKMPTLPRIPGRKQT